MLSSAPSTPAFDQSLQGSHTISMDDLDILEQLTSGPLRLPKFRRREAVFDPLIFAAAVSSGPHITRHHFHHDFFPTDDYPHGHPQIGSYDDCDCTEEDSVITSVAPPQPQAPKYISQQKPRREREREGLTLRRNSDSSSHSVPDEQFTSIEAPKKRRPSLLPSHDPEPLQDILKTLDNSNALYPSKQDTALVPTSIDLSALTSSLPPSKRSVRPALVVQCRARTRIPTPHGPVFLHLYHNNWDAKEHLAVVADSAQLTGSSNGDLIASPIRSRSLDAQWHEGETEMERIIRGAYVGRLSADSSVASTPDTFSSAASHALDFIPAPMVRIHSECFTGETIGSMRCDCGEQLDEAIRLISQPETIRASPSSPSVTIPGRGAVIYLRQEGRGIGLLEKIRAYNLQDLGHDTVSANLLLGHGADERGYEIAAEIMRDLGLGAGGPAEEAKGVRLLTNNPEKMEALEREGIRVAERMEMVPRSWKCGNDHPRRRRRAKTIRSKKPLDESDDDANSDSSHSSFTDQQLRRGGATMIGGGAAHGPELERYLRTKVQRMRHMIDLPTSSASTSTAPTAVQTPSADMIGHAAELAYKIGLVSQDVSDRDDEDDEDDDYVADGEMSRSIRSLMVSTPDLESDRGSARSVSPTLS